MTSYKYRIALACKVSSNRLEQQKNRKTYLVDSNGLSIQSNLVHDFRRIFGVFLANELDKAIALMCLGDSILWQMYIDNAPSLKHKLPYQAVRNSFVDVANVDSSFLVLLPASRSVNLHLRANKRIVNLTNAERPTSSRCRRRSESLCERRRSRSTVARRKRARERESNDASTDRDACDGIRRDFESF